MLTTVEAHPQTTERLVAAECLYEPYDPLVLPWNSISDAVMAMERFNFPKRPESEEKVASIFHNPNAIIVTVRDPFYAMAFVGFSAVLPAVEEYSFPDFEHPERLTQWDVDLATVLYVHCTQLAQSHQGNRIAEPLNAEVLARASARRPDAIYFERDASNTRRPGKERSYAEQLLDAYQDRVVRSFAHRSEYYGEQLFIRHLLGTQATTGDAIAG